MSDAIPWVYDDGGREDAGFRGHTGDCVTRAIAIAAEMDYREVYDFINELSSNERFSSRRARSSNARLGVYKPTIHRTMKELGAVWTPTMFIGSGCRVHLCQDELPLGRLVVSLSKHVAAVVNGCLFDTSDCSREGTRCVYGIWTFA